MAMFSRRVCPECGHSYDDRLSCCPVCKRDNEIRPKDNLLYLPISHELALFLIGLIGLNAISIIVSLFFVNMAKEDEVLAVLLINSISYLIILLIDIILLRKYFRDFLSYFKKWQSYAFGLLGGIILIVSSFTISYIMEMLIPSASTGGNQSTIISMVNTNPIASIIVLAFIGPFTEELAYRVGLYTLLARKSKILAYIVTALIFAAIHIDFFSNNFINELAALPDYLIAGLLFCLIYDLKGFGASFIAHMANNLFAVILIIIQGA